MRSESSSPFNIASYLTEVAEKAPSRIAAIFPKGCNLTGQAVYHQITFQQLDRESDCYAYGLAKIGIRRGCRVLLMVPPGVEFISLTFALFKIGAVLVLIDPGIGKKHLLHCLEEVDPEALVAVPLVHVLKGFHRKQFRHVKHAVTVGRRWFSGAHTLDEIKEKSWRKFPIAAVNSGDAAAILFTTGSTGRPKGVVYFHDMFDAQIKSIRSTFQITEDEVALPAFAPFALFCVAMGTTCVLPHIDPKKPAEVDPKEVIRPVQDFNVSYSFGSPTFWHRVSQYCIETHVRLPSVKKIILAGAPVSGIVLQRLKEILSDGAECYTPYGATEALPITSISSSEILSEAIHLSNQGAGICVGTALPGIALRIIRISDEAFEKWDESLVLPPGKIGEIVVRGAVVTREYYNRKDQTTLAKIQDRSSVWHRMGDVGYLDEKARLWFCGRKSQRIITGKGTLFTVPCEAIFNQHPDVFRSALVGIGSRANQRPVIIIEPRPGRMLVHKQAATKFAEELLDLGSCNELTRDIRDVLFYSKFPVDFRHNAKILREKLAAWAETKVK